VTAAPIRRPGASEGRTDAGVTHDRTGDSLIKTVSFTADGRSGAGANSSRIHETARESESAISSSIGGVSVKMNKALEDGHVGSPGGLERIKEKGQWRPAKRRH
jgi:hypothetical protein